MDGSNLTPDNPDHRAHGKLVPFAIRHGQAAKVSEIAAAKSVSALH